MAKKKKKKRSIFSKTARYARLQVDKTLQKRKVSSAKKKAEDIKKKLSVANNNARKEENALKSINSKIRNL